MWIHQLSEMPGKCGCIPIIVMGIWIHASITMYPHIEDIPDKRA